LRLTAADVEALLTAPTAESKVATATKIIAAGNDYRDDPGQLALARDILAKLATDVEAEVRQGVAWQIAHSPLLTTELAEKMTADVASVAFPILRYAKLSDDVLSGVCEKGDARKTLAVAGRKALSSRVSDAVIKSENVKAIAVLVGNVGATISEAALKDVLTAYGTLPAINIPMAHRADLPAIIVENLIGVVATGVRNQLMEAYNIEPELAAELVERGRTNATIELLKPVARDVSQLEPFVKRLMDAGKLTPSLLFRALCAGEINLFRTGLAARGKLPIIAIDELLRDRGPLGLPALLRRSEIPLSLLPAFKAAITVWRDSGFSGGEATLASYQANVISAVFEDCVSIDDAEIDALLQHLFTPIDLGGHAAA
jgi:uncharacterized protein (DUF2336 family)